MTEHLAATTAHVVVGIDGSEPSEAALSWAIEYASLIGAEVEAIIAWTYPVSLGFAAIASDWSPSDDACQVLTATVTKVLGADAPTTLTQSVREGYPAQVLLDATKDAQLLVVGSRGHGGFAGMLLGSVSANCAEHAECPVLVIHHKSGS